MRILKILTATMMIAPIVTGCSKAYDMQARGQVVEESKIQAPGGMMASGGGGAPASAPAEVAGDAKPKAEAPTSSSPTIVQAGFENDPIETTLKSQQDRYLIKNAVVTIECQDVRKAAESVMSLIKGGKGYLVDNHETVDGIGSKSISMEIRIPYQRFDAALGDIDQLGKSLDRQVNAQDVTEEFVDVQARIRNLRRTEDRLLDHLKRTAKLSDTLMVEKELTRVRETLEKDEGRIRFLAQRIAFSTIQLTLRETARQQALVPAESFSAGKAFSDSTRSLISFLQGALELIIGIGIWSVVWLPIALVAFGVLRKRARARKKRETTP